MNVYRFQMLPPNRHPGLDPGSRLLVDAWKVAGPRIKSGVTGLGALSCILPVSVGWYLWRRGGGVLAWLPSGCATVRVFSRLRMGPQLSLG